MRERRWRAPDYFNPSPEPRRYNVHKTRSGDVVRHRRALTAAALLWSIAFVNVAAARNVALLIGVGQFSDPAMKTHQLLGPPFDLDSMQHALTEHWGFKPADVVALKDEAATHARILTEIAALEQRSSPGDTLLIYFSGHGTSANDNGNSFALPYDTGAWVPYDLEYTAEGVQRTLIIGHRDLLPRLRRLDQSGRWVVVISDSCYSGQVVRSFGETFSRSRFLPLTMRDLGVAKADSAPPPIDARPPPAPYPYQHVVLLSGASDSETGADISTPQALEQAPTVDGRYHGAFTDAFLRLLGGQLVPGTFNYSQGRDALSQFLEHHKFAQHPQLLPAIAEDPQDVGSRPFLGMGASAPAAAPAGPPVRDVMLHVHIEGLPPALKARVAALQGVALVEREADLTMKAHGAEVRLTGPAGDPILTAPATDPKLLRRVAAQAWLNRVLPAGTDALGLRAETDPGTRGNTFIQCESFSVEVRLEKPAYVMVLDLDSQGNLVVLYPTTAAERKVVASGVPTAIPGKEPKDRILVVPPFGIDQMVVLAFEQEPPFFAGLTDAERFDWGGTRADALARGLSAAPGAVGVQQLAVRTYPGSGKVFCGT
jgi:hypothetical protein